MIKIFSFYTYMRQFHVIHWTVILLSFLLTLSAWHHSYKIENEKSQYRFNQEVKRALALVEERMHKYEDALWAGVAAIHSQSHGIDHEEWKRFSDSLQVDERYPGINGIGVIRQMPCARKQQFIEDERRVRPEFSIHPEHQHTECWPIVYIEPVKGNEKAVGLDMAHEKNRFEAAQKAKQTGKPQITGPIILVQDEKRTPGFLFYAPFYKKRGISTKNAEDFKGLVYAPFIMHKLMGGTLQTSNRGVSIRISDGATELYSEYSATNPHYDPNPLYARSHTIEMYGRDWLFEIQSNQSFKARIEHKQSTFILLAGIVIEILLISLFLSLIRNNRLISKEKTAAIDTMKSTQETHQAYIDVSGDGYWDWYLKDDYEYMSPRFWEMFGYSPEEKEHHPKEWQAIIFPDDLKLALENFDKHVATKGSHPFHQEVRYRHKNGDTITVICRGAVIEWDEEGSPVRMIGTHTDITSLKKVEAELRDAQNFHELIFKHNPNLIFVKNEDFEIVAANSAFMSVYPEEMQDKIIGYTTVEEYDDQQAKEFLEQDIKAFEGGYSGVIEKLMFPDGRERTLYTQKIRFEGPDEAVFILGIGQDVTEREEFIEKLEQQKAELKRSNQELDDFAYIASHDLKEPLRGIHNHSSFLKEDFYDVLDDGGKHKIDRIVLLTQRMEKLINDLLFYSRLGRAEVAIQDTDISLVIEDIKTTMEEEERGAVKIEGQLPTIKCDKVRITEVFRNLISNALKYNDKDKKEVEIGFKAVEYDGKTIDAFYVSDNGIGIETKHYESVFKIFKRLHHKEAYGGGSGSGLTFVKKIIERHGGKIWLESGNEGTTFFFTLDEEVVNGE